MPIVSVIVPAWNAAASIERAVGSVLAESGVDLECIVVDDASTDATVEIVRRIAAGDSRVVLVELEANGGVSQARNRGLELARGEWLTLLDADDRFRPGGIAALYRAAVETDARAVIGQQVWTDGRRTWRGPLYDIPDILTPGRKSLVTAPGLLYYVSPHAKLLHRSLVDGLRFEGRVLGDQAWVIRALLRAGDGIEVLADTVYDWIRATPPGAGQSITAVALASARRGAEAAGVAGASFAAVHAETIRVVADPAAGARLASAYAERLLRSDLGPHLMRAVERGDPTIGELFAAIDAFLAGLPPGTLAAGDSLARRIVEPPLLHWRRIPAAARPAFESLARTASTAQPDLAAHVRTPLERWAIGRVLGTSAGPTRAVAFATLALAGAAGTVLVLVRRVAGRVRRLRSRRSG